MQSRFGITLLTVALLAITGIGLVSCKRSGTGVTVIVNNATGGDITNLQIRFTGGSKSSPRLKSAESFEAKVNPNGESHLNVQFADSSGKLHSAEVDVYLERNYSGTIRVTLEPDGKVTWKGETKVWPALCPPNCEKESLTKGAMSSSSIILIWISGWLLTVASFKRSIGSINGSPISVSGQEQQWISVSQLPVS